MDCLVLRVPFSSSDFFPDVIFRAVQEWIKEERAPVQKAKQIPLNKDFWGILHRIVLQFLLWRVVFNHLLGRRSDK